MADGGFVVMFDGKLVGRCYAVSFDYDAWQYTINGETKKLPGGTQSITVHVE